MKITSIKLLLMSLAISSLSSLSGQQLDTIKFERPLMRFDVSVTPARAIAKYSYRNNSEIQFIVDDNYSMMNSASSGYGLLSGAYFNFRALEATGDTITVRLKEPINIYSFSFTDGDPFPIGKWKVEVSRGMGSPIEFDSLNVESFPGSNTWVSRLIEPKDWYGVEEFRIISLDSEVDREAQMFSVAIDNIVFSQHAIIPPADLEYCDSLNDGLGIDWKFANGTGDFFRFNAWSSDTSILEDDKIDLFDYRHDDDEILDTRIFLYGLKKAGKFKVYIRAASNEDTIIESFTIIRHIPVVGDTLTFTSCGDYIWNDSVYTESGIYSQKFVSVTGCDSTAYLDLTVIRLDKTIYQEEDKLFFLDRNASYQWLDCNKEFAPISGATSWSFTPTDNGSFAALISKDGCVDTSSCFTVVGLSTSAISNDAISVYPNPTNGMLQIAIMGEDRISEIQIIDMAGKIIDTIQGSNESVQHLYLNQEGFNYIVVKTIHNNTQYFKVFRI